MAIRPIAPTVSSALALVFVLGIAACSADSPTKAERLVGTVRGTVLSGPRCPVVVAGSPCPDRPWIGEVSASTVDGEVVSSVQTGRDGAFMLDLAPGTYLLTALATAPGRGSSRTVEVVANEPVSVTLQVDTGIR
ncbi:MAG: carboxypeptidase-like regulatory domain-containing protein [Actinomycetota bacterium]